MRALSLAELILLNLLRERERMGTIDQFADDVPDVLASLEQQFGDLRGRALALKEQGADVAAKWNQHFDAQAASIRAAEAAIARVSNVPLPSSQPSPKPSLVAITPKPSDPPDNSFPKPGAGNGAGH